jgi:hypothetical protein
MLTFSPDARAFTMELRKAERTSREFWRVNPTSWEIILMRSVLVNDTSTSFSGYAIDIEEL